MAAMLLPCGSLDRICPAANPFSIMDPIAAQILLLKCVGDEIWSEATCREHGVPEIWIQELADQHESGFDFDRNTIYVDDRVVNQYRGVQDLLLARKLAVCIGIDVRSATAVVAGRVAEVNALKEALDEI